MGCEVGFDLSSGQLAQLLVDLRGVAVGGRGVSSNVCAYEGVVGHFARCGPCTGGSSLSVDDDVVKIDQALFD